MAKFAKILIMIVRLVAVVSIILGALLAAGKAQAVLGAHIGLGFMVALVVLMLAILAFVKKKTVLGILGVVFAILLPVTGLRQIPLQTGGGIDIEQVAHIIVVLLTLGIAESIHAAIRKSEL